MVDSNLEVEEVMVMEWRIRRRRVTRSLSRWERLSLKGRLVSLLSPQ